MPILLVASIVKATSQTDVIYLRLSEHSTSCLIRLESIRSVLRHDKLVTGFAGQQSECVYG